MHGLWQSAEKLAQRKTRPKSGNNLLTALKIVVVFVMVSQLWVFFRLESMSDLSTYFTKIFTNIGVPFTHVALYAGIIAVSILLVKDAIDEYWPQLRLMSSPNIIVSNIATGLLVAVILLMGVFDSTSFIYFQF